MADQGKTTQYFSKVLVDFLMYPRSVAERTLRQNERYERAFDSYSQRKSYNEMDRKFFRHVVDKVTEATEQHHWSSAPKLQMNDVLIDLGRKVKKAIM
jgi:hypothetical protein